MDITHARTASMRRNCNLSLVLVLSSSFTQAGALNHSNGRIYVILLRRKILARPLQNYAWTILNTGKEGPNQMCRLLGIVAAGLLAFGSAHASPILVDPTSEGSAVNAEITSSKCLLCFIDVSISEDLDGAEAALSTGDSFSFDFFDIVVGGLIGVAQIEVDATLALASPDESITGNGFGGFASFLFVINGGHLNWIQPGPIDLGDGTFLSVSFENLFEFGLGNTTTVSATISRVASVPEPGTAALLIVGLLALWIALRRPTVLVGRSPSSASMA